MAALAAILLTTAGGKKLDFMPRSTNPQTGQSVLVQGTGIPLGDRKLTLSLNRTSTGRIKAGAKIQIPVVSEVAGTGGTVLPTLVRTSYAEATFAFDATSTPAERELIVQGLAAAIMDPAVFNVVAKLEDVY